MDLDYDELLDRGYTELASKKTDDTRFKIPEIDTIIQGRRTIIRNAAFISKALKRETNHLMKFFTKETGVPSTFDGTKIILNGVFNSYKMSNAYKKYIDEYIVCKQCGKPDTILKSEKGIIIMKCEACGAINSVRKL